LGIKIETASKKGKRMKLLLKNILNIYTPMDNLNYGEIKHLQKVDILIESGEIKQIEKNIKPNSAQIIDCTNKTVLPGFVDAHTHPVFGKTREDEFMMRIEGKSYEAIAAAGGGIRNSVRRFRELNKNEIKAITQKKTAKFFEYGTTTIEAKSGYGLSLEDEIKSLEIINELNQELELDFIPTFLGAHEVPDEYQNNRDAYIELCKNEMIPLVAEKKLAKYCDVFCEEGVFTVEESREILEEGLKYNLKPRVHADELSPFGGAEMAAEIKAVTADHLVMASVTGIEMMAKANVIPILLPGTTFFLRKDRYAQARKMIDLGCEVAISTDFNPGSSTTQNMQLIWSIAALKMGMLPNELLWASTLTPAKSLNLHRSIGSIEAGKKADLLILDIPNLNYLPYNYGVNNIDYTLKNGKIVYQP
jgi:imidazolonepropionase